MPETLKTKIKRDVGDFLVEQVLKTVRQAESPIEGEEWDALSPKYKKLKEKEGSTPIANMELHGDMLDSLTFEETDDGIELGFFDSEAAKADGHNHFSGASKNATAPKRRFLPGEGEEFVPQIQKEIQKIIADNISDNMVFKAKDFEGVDTRSELKDALNEFFPGLSRSELKSTVSQIPSLYDLLDELDLLDLL